MRPSYDFLVVGAGLYGATFARHCRDAGKKVLVVDKREHVAGNCYDVVTEGIPVAKYGPHFFHCPDKGTWDFVNRFSAFNDVRAKPRVNYQGRIFSFPINLMTLHQLWGVCTPAEAEQKLAEVRLDIPRPKNFEDFILSRVGREIYEVFFEGYTTKQWGRHPSQLPAAIAKRIPVRLTFDENYFPDTHVYQGVPVGGYTRMFDNMLDGIEVQLGVDYLKERQRLSKMAKTILYTGPLDALYKCRHGKLEYRSLRFETERKQGDFQGTTVVNYTDVNVPFTRITEWKHKFKIDAEHTFVTREFPAEYEDTGEAYYPINNDLNTALHRKYRQMADADGMLVGGRAADYQYYDMNMVIPAATRLAERVLGVGRGTFGV
ncbi:MAG: UDP-galactopyranose mutase [Armatimonadetes bacterium]|nr:UDP-galactopyranose mutase [Armatimonadota bacterium]